MKNKGFITGIMLLAVLTAALIARAFYIGTIMDKINVDEQLMNLAMLKENGVSAANAFLDGFSVKAVYVLCMSFSCMVFGNFAVAGVYLNVGLQVAAALLLFSAGKNICNRYFGLILGAVYAVFPMIVSQVSRVDEINMLMLFMVIGIWCFSVIVYLIRYLISKKKKALLPKENMAEIAKEEQNMQADLAAVPDSSMKEIILDDAKEQKPRFIENPLPVPKRRAHREMDYAIEIDGNDDYDITDMTGKDFFDIE